MNDVTKPNFNPKISIVIPVYNEEVIVESAIDELSGKIETVIHETYEIILAENGSKDNTLNICKDLENKYPQVRVLSHHEPNYGAALKRGILSAKGIFIICDEIDLCDIEFYSQSLKILEQQEADFVVGSKNMKGSLDQRPFIRKLGTKVINTMLKYSLGFHGTDTHGLKAFRAKSVLPIVNECMVDKDLFASELVIRVERKKLKLAEIPIQVNEKRPPSIHLYKRVPHVLKNLARLIYEIRIREMIR